MIGLALQATAGDAAAGKGQFAVCEACHGLRGEGNRELGAPRLAGIEPWYFARQLANFGNGLRGAAQDDERGQQMRAMASTVGGEVAVADLIAYVATLAPPPAPAWVSGNSAEGRRHFQLCVACHGAQAQGNEALGAPALAGRSDWYLLAQLEAFRTGRRGANAADSFGVQMRAIALALPDEAALHDVVAFIRNIPRNESEAPSATWRLRNTCPASFERLAGDACAFRSLYELYAPAADHGGLRVALPPQRSQYTAEQIDLGRYLFFDPLLSTDRKLSCAHCHHPDFGYADGRAHSAGAGGAGFGPGRSGGAALTRGAPTLWNVGFLRRLFWDGRAGSLEDQAAGPLFASDEMATSPERLVSALDASEAYRGLFATAFRRAAVASITVKEVATALAAFESSLVSFNSRYDRYAHGDEAALSEQEIAGHNVFRGFVARCSQCHTPPLFTDGEVAVVGAPAAEGAPFDRGAGAFDADPARQGAFRVPTLRNIARTAPYFQAGQFATLADVVHFYNDTRGHAVPPGVSEQVHWHIAMSAPQLSASDEAALVAFLGALTDESMQPEVPKAVPSGLPVVSHSGR